MTMPFLKLKKFCANHKTSGLKNDPLFRLTSAKILVRLIRSNYTMFSNIIAGIPDWSTVESQALILQIASGCFLDDDDIVGRLIFRVWPLKKIDAF